jgi:hypothetical protein
MRFHGVLAPDAKLRAATVPNPPDVKSDQTASKSAPGPRGPMQGSNNPREREIYTKYLCD